MSRNYQLNFRFTRLGKFFLIASLFLLPFTDIYPQQWVPDSFITVASKRYKKASFIKKIFMGSNYRKEWSAPVSMPIFHINKERGGFFIIGIGGGMQTKSLLLEDKQCNTWALRTVDKEVDSLVPPKLRKTFLRKIIRNFLQDLVSAAHPYAALTIPGLASASGVLSGSQQLFFVPDDPALGIYRETFGNK